MTPQGYTVLGWIVWQIGKRLMKRQIAENRVKIGAIGVIVAVVAAGIVAGRSGSDG